MEWFLANKTWVFSGIGTGIILFIVGLLFNNNSKTLTNKQIQKSGSNSVNIQIGGNSNIETKKDKNV
ncbi:MAG: hypothetical protein A2Y25_02335 [Candidatus Melainabacteria bacterium GWF2_37_15]|nr:MAG: hypothetical protein A2Y25_02335 [Candidatus Melainabacteria bacterium GWF2_37_15]